MPALHYACLNEATDPQQPLGWNYQPAGGAWPSHRPPRLFVVIRSLLSQGADPKAKDLDNDTALEAILSLSGEEPEDEALQATSFSWGWPGIGVGEPTSL